MEMPRDKRRSRILKWTILGVIICIFAFFAMALFSFVRSIKEGWSLKHRIQTALERGEPLIGTRPGSEVLALGFLRSVFGDDPVLLAAVEQTLRKAAQETPELLQKEISVLGAVYEPGTAGSSGNVVVYIVGELKDKNPPALERNGFLRCNLPDELFSLSNSLFSLAGREVQIIGGPPALKEHRANFDALMVGDTSVLETLIKKNHRARVVVTNPALLMPDSVRACTRVIIGDLSGSREGGQGRATVVTTTRSATAAVKRLLSHWQTLSLGVVRTRSSSLKGRRVADALSRVQIESVGTSVTVRCGFDAEIVDLGLRAVRGTGRAVWRKKNAPTETDLAPSKNGGPAQ